MEWKRAQVKFAGDKGFGFLDGATGRVFFHKAGFCNPTVVLHPEPHIQPLKADACKRPAEGDWVAYVEEKNDKGLMADQWCYLDDLRQAEKKVAEAALYRIVYRQVKRSQPICDTATKSWVEPYVVTETAYSPTYEPAILASLLDYKGEEMLRHGQFQLQRFDTEVESSGQPSGWVVCNELAGYNRYFAEQSLFSAELGIVHRRKVA